MQSRKSTGTMRREVFSLIFLCVLCLSVVTATAQTPQCGFADSINYPIDTNLFQLAQDFGVPSGRHQGRYHTGEDWFAGRIQDYGAGLHVAAAAVGRVTYSSTIGWGRDGGVVILEHTFTDGTVLYTQYGHMQETDTAKFPAVYSCVDAGEIIGAVGNVRPAPHVHFEVRVNNPDYPGPGYSWENPVTAGWRNPSKLVQNWQAILQPSHLWHLDLADETGPIAPPVELVDHSLIYLDAGRVGRLSPDGRVLWRINLERPAVSVIPDADLARIVYADGSMQRVNLDGALFEPQQTGIRIDSTAMIAAGVLFAHSLDNTLIRFDIQTQTQAWQLADVNPVIRSASGQVTGLITQNNELLTISQDGTLLDRAQLREPGGLTVATDGNLLAYTRGGLWRILSDGTWELLSETVPQGGESSAVTQAPDGILYLFDGQFLYAYNRDLAQIWQTELTDVSGTVDLSLYDTNLLLTSNHGSIIAVRASDGGLCNRTRIFGSERAKLWHSLGGDGILRVAVSDQIIGFDWQTFLGGCA